MFIVYNVYIFIVFQTMSMIKAEHWNAFRGAPVMRIHLSASGDAVLERGCARVANPNWAQAMVWRWRHSQENNDGLELFVSRRPIGGRFLKCSFAHLPSRPRGLTLCSRSALPTCEGDLSDDDVGAARRTGDTTPRPPRLFASQKAPP